MYSTGRWPQKNNFVELLGLSLRMENARLSDEVLKKSFGKKKSTVKQV